MSYRALERWRALPKDSPRGEYFRVLREAVTEFYLADPANPWQQSGRSSRAARWEETRRCLVKAVHHDGDFMDVGCANGLLLETLIGWARDEGFSLRSHGIDIVPELIALARQRFPDHSDSFEVANAFLLVAEAAIRFRSHKSRVRSDCRLGRLRSPSVRGGRAWWAADCLPLQEYGGPVRRHHGCCRAMRVFGSRPRRSARRSDLLDRAA